MWDASRSLSLRPIRRRPALESDHPVDTGRRDHIPSHQEQRPPKNRNRGNDERPHGSRNPLCDQGHHHNCHYNKSPYRSPGRSDEDDPRCPLSQAIMEAPIPPGMEKPPHLKEYDGISDPFDHIDGFDAMLHYHNVGGPIKCRLFPTTLRKAAMDWYKSLALGSITSWRNLKNQFIRSFMASCRHLKTEAALEAII